MVKENGTAKGEEIFLRSERGEVENATGDERSRKNGD